ncbi:MAG: 3-deoxy-8-phosphooctulonate synthase [Planctomycetota bacterium]
MTPPHGRQCTVGGLSIGPGSPLTIIGGPCVLETIDLGLAVGSALRDACERLELGYVFKASYDKANRSSIASYRGPGPEQGLAWLSEVGSTLGVPTTTDIHEPAHAAPVAERVDLLQIPAFLSRQTDLLLAAGQAAEANGKAVNVKKGQFMAPTEMRGPVRKLREAGCGNVMLTERGTFFGYHRLVNDFTGLGDLLELDADGESGPAPVCFDVTHSTQLPGAGAQTGGRPERAPLLARAAAAAGVHALFIEVHPDPANAKSDGATVLDIATATDVIETAARIRHAIDAG